MTTLGLCPPHHDTCLHIAYLKAYTMKFLLGFVLCTSLLLIVGGAPVQVVDGNTGQSIHSMTFSNQNNNLLLAKLDAAKQRVVQELTDHPQYVQTVTWPPCRDSLPFVLQLFGKRPESSSLFEGQVSFCKDVHSRLIQC